MERAGKVFVLRMRVTSVGLGFPSALHGEITVRGRCCDAGYPPATSHKDRVHGQKKYDLQVHARYLREKLQDEWKSQSKHRASSPNLETTLGFLPFSPSFLCIRNVALCFVMFFWFALFFNPRTLTDDQTAADAASRGLTDKITSVSFHP